MKQTRVALYVRVSLDAKDKTGEAKQTFENQLQELKAFVERQADQGWLLTEVYSDKMTGKTDKRPGFMRMMQDASERRFDLLVFWALDRLSREGALETLQHLQRLTSHGVDWWSFREQYLRSIGPFRDGVLSILACVAAQERIRLSERTRAGLARARREGKTLGRRPVVANVDKIRALRDEGLSLRQIADKLHLNYQTVSRRLSA
jgi:DNA invertase Pin-like site-specific DNA recombinase